MYGRIVSEQNIHFTKQSYMQWYSYCICSCTAVESEKQKMNFILTVFIQLQETHESCP